VAEKPNTADVCQRRDRAPGLQSCSYLDIDDKTIYPYNLMYHILKELRRERPPLGLFMYYFPNPAIREARWLLIKT
jgi:hypothetical protein